MRGYCEPSSGTVPLAELRPGAGPSPHACGTGPALPGRRGSERAKEAPGLQGDLRRSGEQHFHAGLGLLEHLVLGSQAGQDSWLALG